MSVAVLISGRGSNMQALLDAGLPITTVISNEAEAKGLETAAARGTATPIVEHRRFSSREAFDAALACEIDRAAPQLIALAGFMRVLTPGFVARYKERLLNIHPSFLPACPDLRTHERLLAAGAKVHHCIVHFVTPTLVPAPTA